MSGRWMRCGRPDSRWLEAGRGVVPRIRMPHEYIGPGPARVLPPRAHAGRKRPAGHLARPLDDGRLLDATRNFSLSHRTHQAKLPERRPEAGPWQERRGGCGKSSEHDHYFPSRADRFHRVVSGIEDAISSLRHGLKSRRFLAIGCRKLGIAFTFACAARV